FEFTLEGRFRACKGPDQPPQSGSLPSALAAMRFASKKLKKIPAKMCQVSSILFGLRGVTFLRPQRPTWCNRFEDDCCNLGPVTAARGIPVQAPFTPQRCRNVQRRNCEQTIRAYCLGTGRFRRPHLSCYGPICIWARRENS